MKLDHNKYTKLRRIALNAFQTKLNESSDEVRKTIIEPHKLNLGPPPHIIDPFRSAFICELVERKRQMREIIIQHIGSYIAARLMSVTLHGSSSKTNYLVETLFTTDYIFKQLMGFPTGIRIPHPRIFHMRDGEYWLTPIHLQYSGDQLHSETGPSVIWEDGTEEWYFRGVQVPKHVLTHPERLTVDEIFGESNIQVREVMITKFGPKNLLSGAKVIDQDLDQYGGPRKLLDVTINSSRIRGVMVRCPTTHLDYVLIVPPNITTAKAAVAWTFFMTPEEYDIKEET